MNDEVKEISTIERVSAFLDGQTSHPKEDQVWVESELERRKRYEGYKRIHELSQNVPTPEFSPDFSDRVVITIRKYRRQRILRNVYAAAASILLVLAGLISYMSFHSSMEISQPVINEARTDPMFLASNNNYDEETLWLYLADTMDHYSFYISLVTLEEIPDEEWISILAGMQPYEETVDSTNPVTDGYSTWEWYVIDETPSFMDIFEIVDELNEGEAFFLNEMLRTFLDKA